MQFDRVSFGTATTGTGTITADAATSGFRTMAVAAIPDGTSVEYAIEDGTAWETGTGVTGATATTLTRVVSQSSNANALLVLTGAAKCFLTPIASRLNALNSGTTSTVGGRIRRSTNQSIPVGAGYTLLIFDAAPLQQGGTFFSAGTPTEVIFPEDGLFQGQFEATGASGATTVLWETEVRIGGAVVGNGAFTAIASATAPLKENFLRVVTTGQKITIGVRHNNATPLDIITEGDHSPDVWLAKIGGAAASAGGATTQIQYNNAGVIAGDADFTWDAVNNDLVLGGVDTGIIQAAITNEPAAPAAGQLLYYTKNIAGRLMPKVKGPSGLDYSLQAALWGNANYIWTQTTTTGGLWTGTVGAGAGTYTTALPTTTSVYTTIKRARYANVVTTLNQVLGQRNTEALFFRGAAANQGGFFFHARIGFDAWTNGGRMFAGMHSATTVVSADPSTLNNTVGFCVDAADNGAITFLTRGTVATKAATGMTIVSGKGYDVYIFCAANSTQYTWRIVDINAGTEISGTATLNLPTNTVMLTAGALASNAALTTVTAIHLGVGKIYVETDY